LGKIREGGLFHQEKVPIESIFPDEDIGGPQQPGKLGVHTPGSAETEKEALIVHGID
jgi:hypothetical protein